MQEAIVLRRAVQGKLREYGRNPFWICYNAPLVLLRFTQALHYVHSILSLIPQGSRCSSLKKEKMRKALTVGGLIGQSTVPVAVFGPKAVRDVHPPLDHAL